MENTTSGRLRVLLAAFNDTVTSLSNSQRHSSPEAQALQVEHAHITEELDRLGLWAGNIGALHPAESALSLESRLEEAPDVLQYIFRLLDDMGGALSILSEIVTGKREARTADATTEHDGEQSEDLELIEEIRDSITRLFRASKLIRQAAPTDIFAKALSRSRYRFNDQFDISHVGHKYPKLESEELQFLRHRLGRSNAQRRQYLSYIHNHREMLRGAPNQGELCEASQSNDKPRASRIPNQYDDVAEGSSHRPATLRTKATSLLPEMVRWLLPTKEEPDTEDVGSITTITRSITEDPHYTMTDRIPRLKELRSSSKHEFECPFCCHVQKFRSNCAWKKRVFADIRAYVCTFPECDSRYFCDVNDWFRHEMGSHRVKYVCRLCSGGNFRTKDKYLTHPKDSHKEMLEVGDKNLVLCIAQQPLQELSAQDCPFCEDWEDCLREHSDELPPNTTSGINVTPAVFQRHLASHLEQLALFAIPITPESEDDSKSDVAINSQRDGSMEDQLPTEELELPYDDFDSPGFSYEDNTSVNVDLSDINTAIMWAKVKGGSATDYLKPSRTYTGITESALIAAAEDEDFGVDLIKILFQRTEPNGCQVTDNLWRAALQKKSRGKDLLKLLLAREDAKRTLPDYVARAMVEIIADDRELSLPIMAKSRLTGETPVRLVADSNSDILGSIGADEHSASEAMKMERGSEDPENAKRESNQDNSLQERPGWTCCRCGYRNDGVQSHSYQAGKMVCCNVSCYSDDCGHILDRTHCEVWIEGQAERSVIWWRCCQCFLKSTTQTGFCGSQKRHAKCSLCRG